MSEVTQEMLSNVAGNEWGTKFKLGKPGVNEREFDIKDLGYYDYVKFVQLAKPLVIAAADGIKMRNTDTGELAVDFDPKSIDIGNLLDICEKELPALAWLVCRQTDPKIKEAEVAELAGRPQRLIEIVLMQVFHNKMIEEFISFFPRLTELAKTLIPSMGSVAPVEPTQ